MEASKNHINNGKNTIIIRGIYDCNGGVEDLKVVKIDKFAPFGALDFKKTTLFEGDIYDICKEHNKDGIKNYLECKFKEEGYEVIFSII